MICDCETPDFFRRETRRSRRPRRCYECGRAINVSDRYEASSGVWSGEARTYHCCLRCTAIRDALEDEDESGCCVAFGRVREALHERCATRREARGETRR